MPSPPHELSLRLSTGTLRAHRFGPATGPLVLCVHGLSANSRSFDFLAQALSASGRSVVAIDLRGRGWSDATGPGTYGWVNHAKDALEVAAMLGAERFDYVGHSMGAFVGMEVARRAEGRVRKLVLIDALGTPEAAAIEAVLAAVKRLGTVHADAEAYVAGVRRVGTIDPWSDYWETHYRYDLVPTAGGVSPRTHRDAILEDLTYGSTQAPATMWPLLAGDTLLVRSARPMGPAGGAPGFVVTKADRDRFVATVPGVTAVEIDANHYGVMMHADTAKAIAAFISS